MSTHETTRPGGLSFSGRRVAIRYGLQSGWALLALTAVPFVFIESVPLRVQYLPLVASVLLLGLPHGAVDHLLLARQRNEQLTPRWLAIVGGLYLVFGLLYAVVWFRLPVVAFVFFILLTWFHWGQGELYPLRLVGAEYLTAPGQRLLTILVRGGAPMLVPLLAFPEQYEFVASTLVGLFDPTASSALAALFEPGTRAVVALLYGTLVVLTLGLGYLRTASRQPWLVDTGEILLLTAYFLVVPPILAIGLYFCFWHSVRHVLRVVLLHDGSARALERNRVFPAIRQFVRDAAPLTAGALSLLGGLYLLVPRTPGSTADLVGLYLVLIAVLTLPHVVIVTWLDAEQHLLGRPWSGQ